MARYKFNLLLFHETPSSFLVGRQPSDREDENSFWLPKGHASCGQQITKHGITTGVFMVEEWLCGKKGLDILSESQGSDEEDEDDDVNDPDDDLLDDDDE